MHRLCWGSATAKVNIGGGSRWGDWTLTAELGRDLCCVLPLEVLDSIFVGGPDASSALKVAHREFDLERIALDFSFCVSVGDKEK